eukprot:5395897-Pyramimonas_sp.AAC.1
MPHGTCALEVATPGLRKLSLVSLYMQTKGGLNNTSSARFEGIANLLEQVQLPVPVADDWNMKVRRLESS